jgi:hypothetical protein
MDFQKVTKERIREILIDPVEFSEHALGMPCVSKTQEKIFRSKAKRRLIVAGRRWGKTTGIAILTLHATITTLPRMQKERNNKNINEIIMFGPSWEQCEIFMDAVRDVYGNLNPFFKGMIKKTVDKIYEVHINGIKIIAKSATKNSRAIRGHGRNVGMIIRDEDAFIPDDSMKVIRPVRLSNSAYELVGSTVAGQNHFFKDYESDIYDSYLVTSYDNKFLDPKDLDEEKKTMTEAEFGQEFMCEFIDDRYSVFPQVLLDEATEFNEKFKTKPEDNISYVMGLDFAKKKDETVLMIGHMENNHIYVDFVKEIIPPTDGRFWENALKEIEYYVKLFGVNTIYADQTGLGDAPTETLRNNLLEKNIMVHVKGIDFTRRVKNGRHGLVNSLLMKFERREVHFPYCKKLIRQLKNIRFETSDSPQQAGGTYGRYTHIGHDDYVMAFTLMVNALPDQNEECYHTISSSRAGNQDANDFNMGRQREHDKLPGLIVTNKMEGGMGYLRRW